MATRRKSKSDLSPVQQPLASQDFCADTTQNQNAPPVIEITTGWPGIAEAAWPNFMQVANGATAEAIAMKAHSGRDIEQIVARHGLRWSLPPQLFDAVVTLVATCCERIRESPGAIEDFLQRFGPRGRPAVYYEVFHCGRVGICGRRRSKSS